MKYLLFLTPVCALLLSTACTQSPQKLVSAGNRYHDKKKYNEASILYQKAINKDKTYGEAYYREGLNLIDSGDPINAAKFLRRAVDLQPNNMDAASKLAEIYLSAYSTNPKRFKALLPDIRDLDQKILQKDPNSFPGLRLQALLALVDNDKNKALEIFAKANQVKPHAPDLIYLYAETLVSVQRTPEAEALVRETLASDPKWARGYDFLYLLYTRQKEMPKAEAVLRERVQKNPSDVIAIQNLTNYLAATNRFSEAETEIKRILDDKKTFPTARQIAGDFYFRGKKFDQALQQYQAGLNEDAKNSTVYNQRIIGVYEVTGRRDDALKLAKGLVDKNPKDTALNEMYAALLLQTSDPAEIAKSVDPLKKLLQNSPLDGALHLDVARAYFGTNQFDKALTESLEAIQDESKGKPRPAVVLGARLLAARIYEDRAQHAKALEQTGFILQVEPGNPDARLIRARALIGVNQISEAQTTLESLLQEFPQVNDGRILLANLYLGQRQFDKASQEFEKTWKASPADARGFIGLQAVKLAQGKGEDAVRELQSVMDHNPKNLALRYQLANFQATAGGQTLRSDPNRANHLFQQAADNYKEILKTTTNSADVWLRLGILQRQLAQYDAAMASFEQASNADPRNADSALQRAMLLDFLGKKKESLDAYNKVLGIDPENALALNNLAFMNAQDGNNLDQAMTFAQRAKKKIPNSPDISDTLGYVYYRKNLNDEALRIFRQIVEESPQNPTFRLHLAMALEKQGDKQAARDEAQKALKNASQPKDQDRIRTFLSQLG